MGELPSSLRRPCIRAGHITYLTSRSMTHRRINLSLGWIGTVLVSSSPSLETSSKFIHYIVDIAFVKNKVTHPNRVAVQSSVERGQEWQLKPFSNPPGKSSVGLMHRLTTFIVFAQSPEMPVNVVACLQLANKAWEKLAVSRWHFAIWTGSHD